MMFLSEASLFISSALFHQLYTPLTWVAFNIVISIAYLHNSLVDLFCLLFHIIIKIKTVV